MISSWHRRAPMQHAMPSCPVAQPHSLAAAWVGIFSARLRIGKPKPQPQTRSPTLGKSRSFVAAGAADWASETSSVRGVRVQDEISAPSKRTPAQRAMGGGLGGVSGNSSWLRGLDAYSRHKKFINDYVLSYGKERTDRYGVCRGGGGHAFMFPPCLFIISSQPLDKTAHHPPCARHWYRSNGLGLWVSVDGGCRESIKQS